MYANIHPFFLFVCLGGMAVNAAPQNSGILESFIDELAGTPSISFAIPEVTTVSVPVTGTSSSSGSVTASYITVVSEIGGPAITLVKDGTTTLFGDTAYTISAGGSVSGAPSSVTSNGVISIVTPPSESVTSTSALGPSTGISGSDNGTTSIPTSSSAPTSSTSSPSTTPTTSGTTTSSGESTNAVPSSSSSSTSSSSAAAASTTSSRLPNAALGTPQGFNLSTALMKGLLSVMLGAFVGAWYC